MIGLGTLINTGAVLAGGLIGMVCKRGLRQNLQDILMQASGVTVIFIGIAGTLQRMFTVSDELLTGVHATPEQRQTSFTAMMEVALDTAAAL